MQCAFSFPNQMFAWLFQPRCKRKRRKPTPWQGRMIMTLMLDISLCPGDEWEHFLWWEEFFVSSALYYAWWRESQVWRESVSCLHGQWSGPYWSPPSVNPCETMSPGRILFRMVFRTVGGESHAYMEPTGWFIRCHTFNNWPNVRCVVDCYLSC